jgi:hypothetical protein
MEDEELNEIEARSDAADIPRLVDEIRRFQPIIEASRQLEEARSRSDYAFKLLSRASEEAKKAEAKLRAALAAF